MADAQGSPRVDFYVLESSDDRARWLTACRLVEKAYLAEQTVYVHAADAAEAAAIDELLWTYADRSFVPHALAGAGPEAPVTVGAGDALPAQVLVQLAATAPADVTLYERVAEFVDADPVRREQGRRRYAWYREQGARLETHKVGAQAT